MKRKATALGFTLIELLVVISIISLLSSVVLSSLNTARAKARDAKRLTDIQAIRTAIEMYYTDKGYYPNPARGYDVVHGLGYDSTCAGLIAGCGHCHRWCTLETLLQPYIAGLPRDPFGTSQSSYYYSYSSNAPNDQMYGLSAVLEVPNAISQGDGGFYTNMVEFGPQPGYCKSKYNRDWLNRNNTGDWSTVCDIAGGN